MRLRQQRLAQRIVDLVRAGVREIFALEPDLRAPALRQVAHRRQRRGPTRPSRAARASSSSLEFRDRQERCTACSRRSMRRHQRLGHVAPAEGTEAAALIRQVARQQLGQQPLALSVLSIGTHVHALRSPARNAARAARHKCIRSAPALAPGASSTPLDTSTPKGRTLRDRLAPHSPATARRPESVASGAPVRRACVQSAACAGAAARTFEQQPRRR